MLLWVADVFLRLAKSSPIMRTVGNLAMIYSCLVEQSSVTSRHNRYLRVRRNARQIYALLTISSFPYGAAVRHSVGQPTPSAKHAMAVPHVKLETFKYMYCTYAIRYTMRKNMSTAYAGTCPIRSSTIKPSKQVRL